MKWELCIVLLLLLPLPFHPVCHIMTATDHIRLLYELMEHPLG